MIAMCEVELGSPFFTRNFAKSFDTFIIAPPSYQHRFVKLGTRKRSLGKAITVSVSALYYHNLSCHYNNRNLRKKKRIKKTCRTKTPITMSFFSFISTRLVNYDREQ